IQQLLIIDCTQYTYIPLLLLCFKYIFFFQAEDGIRDGHVTGVQTCALPISSRQELSSRAAALSQSVYAFAQKPRANPRTGKVHRSAQGNRENSYWSSPRHTYSPKSIGVMFGPNLEST